MDNIILNNEYFKSSKLDRKNILVTTKLNELNESNIQHLIETLIFLTIKTDKDIIADFSELESIDSFSIKKLYYEVNKILAIGRRIKIVVREEKPKIYFSIGDSYTNMELYLSRDEALDGLLYN